MAKLHGREGSQGRDDGEPEVGGGATRGDGKIPPGEDE